MSGPNKKSAFAVANQHISHRLVCLKSAIKQIELDLSSARFPLLPGNISDNDSGDLCERDTLERLDSDPCIKNDCLPPHLSFPQPAVAGLSGKFTLKVMQLEQQVVAQLSRGDAE